MSLQSFRRILTSIVGRNFEEINQHWLSGKGALIHARNDRLFSALEIWFCEWLGNGSGLAGVTSSVFDVACHVTSQKFIFSRFFVTGNSTTIIIAAVCVVAAALLIVLIVFLLIRKRANDRRRQEVRVPAPASSRPAPRAHAPASAPPPYSAAVLAPPNGPPPSYDGKAIAWERLGFTRSRWTLV